MDKCSECKNCKKCKEIRETYVKKEVKFYILIYILICIVITIVCMFDKKMFGELVDSGNIDEGRKSLLDGSLAVILIALIYINFN